MSLRFSFLKILASTDFEKMSQKMINMYANWGRETLSEKKFCSGKARIVFS